MKDTELALGISQSLSFLPLSTQVQGRVQVTTESLSQPGCNPHPGGIKEIGENSPGEEREGGQDCSEAAGEALRPMQGQDTTALLPPKVPLCLQKGKRQCSPGAGHTDRDCAWGIRPLVLRTRLGAFGERESAGCVPLAGLRPLEAVIFIW